MGVALCLMQPVIGQSQENAGFKRLLAAGGGAKDWSLPAVGGALLRSVIGRCFQWAGLRGLLSSGGVAFAGVRGLRRRWAGLMAFLLY